MHVQVYWNLHKTIWSIRDAKTRLIIAHKSQLSLIDASFKVSEAGRQRVLRERRKNVHAYIEGLLEDVDCSVAATLRRVRYDPYKYNYFMVDEHPVFYASSVIFNEDRSVWILAG
jgi:hypothetical protein